jgi:hypothetical protein
MGLVREAGTDLSPYSGWMLYHYSVARGYLVVKEVEDQHIRQLHVQPALLKYHCSVSRGCPAARVSQTLHSHHPPVAAVQRGHMDPVLPPMILHNSAGVVHATRSCSPRKRKDWPAEHMGCQEASLVGHKDWP